MRRGSEDALAKVKDNWDTVLQQSLGNELQFSRELFAIRDSLENAPALTAALEDYTRDDGERAQLARHVFTGKVAGAVEDLLAAVVREHWSEDGDLFEVLEVLAVDSVLAEAQRIGALEVVEEELYRAKDTLMRERQLRLSLSDKYRSTSDRQLLGRKVFGEFRESTQQLLARAIERARYVPLSVSLSRYLTASEARTKHLIASVTAAVPFTQEQEARLVSILERKYNQKVKVYITLDPSIIGGAQVHIGNDVIDGTLRGRISAVKEAFTN